MLVIVTEVALSQTHTAGWGSSRPFKQTQSRSVYTLQEENLRGVSGTAESISIQKM